MISRILDSFSHDIGIDLGTANTLVYVRGRGIVIHEPSVVAINQRTKQILAVGGEAQRMVGRTPSYIVATRPLVDGVISDFEVTEAMLRHFIEKVHQEQFAFLPRPRVVIGIPYGVTEVERRAVEEGALSAGARQVFLIEEPLAAAIGARLPVQEPTGSMVVDIGGGTTEVAAISMGGIVASRSLRIAGDEMNEDIMNYAREEHNLLLGERTAESLKIGVGSAVPLKEAKKMPMRGRDLISGLPKELMISDLEVREAIKRSILALINNVRATVEETPPELVADIMDQGIVLCGGGALLRGLDQLINEATGIKTIVADDPLTCVVRGAGIVLEDLDVLKEVLLRSDAGAFV